MSVVSIERQQSKFNGTGALKLESAFQPQLRLILNPETEFIPSPKVTSISEYKERKKREQVMNGSVPPVLITSEIPKQELVQVEPEPRPELITGFSVRDEARSVTRIYYEARADGLSHEESFDKAWKDHEGNLIRYHFEYTLRFSVVVNPSALNNQSEWVNSESGRRIVDMTLGDERNGAVLTSVIETEKLLKEAPIGAMVADLSPSGDTGKVTKEGKKIVYKEAELFFYEKISEREIRAFTFIADLTYEQMLNIYKFFANPHPDISNMQLSELERAAAMVSRPFLIPEGTTTAEDFLSVIEAEKGGGVMREANGANRTFREARELLRLEDELILLPQKVQESRDLYKGYLERSISQSDNPDVFEDIQQRMELSLLEDIKILEGKVEKDASQPYVSASYRQAMNSTQRIDNSFIQQNYAEQLYFIKTRMLGLGCNVTSSSDSELILGQSLNEILSGGGSIGEEGEGLHPICIFCRKKLCEGRCFPCERKRAA